MSAKRTKSDTRASAANSPIVPHLPSWIPARRKTVSKHGLETRSERQLPPFPHDFLARAANDGFPPIVLKNSKNPHSRFSAKTRCIGKASPVRTERAVRAAHIAKALIWPTPSPRFPTGALWRSFSPFFGENRVFQHNQLKTVISCAAWN